jgi:hypothetical protein
MSALCAIIAALLMMGASGWCCYRITTREDTPLPLTTWLIFSLVVPAVALAAALQTGLYQWGNAQMVVDAVSVACVLGVLWAVFHAATGDGKGVEARTVPGWVAFAPAAGGGLSERYHAALERLCAFLGV